MPSSDQKSPFIGQAGRVRLTPLEQAVASSKVGGNDKTANRADPTPTGAANRSGKPVKASPDVLPEGVSQEQVDDATARANDGDQTAIDWLKTLGLAAGAAVGTGVLAATMKRRGLKSAGADHIAADAAAPSAASVSSKPARLPPPAERPLLPDAKTLALPAPKTIYSGGAEVKQIPYVPNIPPHQPFRPGVYADPAVMGKAVRRLIR